MQLTEDFLILNTTMVPGLYVNPFPEKVIEAQGKKVIFLFEKE